MAIVSTELLARLSGGAGNSDPFASTGGVMSTSTVLNPTVSEENLFANVDGAEASAGSLKFRGLYFLNNNGSLTLENTVIWISTQSASTETAIRMALADEGLNATIETLSDEDDVPATVTFTAPATKAGGLSMGNVPTLQRFGFWLERDVDAGTSAFDNDDWAFQIEGDTAA